MAGTGNLLRRPPAAAAAAALALGLVAGCGGGSSSTTTVTTTAPSGGLSPKGGLSSTETARGPGDLAANLAWLVKKDYLYFDDFKADCPTEPTPPNYPVQCTMTAVDTSRPQDRKSRPDGAHRPVRGTATILGVYQPTRTYAYQLDYRYTGSR